MFITQAIVRRFSVNWSHLYEIASLVALVASALLLTRAKGYVRVLLYLIVLAAIVVFVCVTGLHVL